MNGFDVSVANGRLRGMIEHHFPVVLVSGAIGGVGAFAVQLAAASRAYVISTARPGEDADAFLRDLGTHATVDYTGDVPAAVAALRPAGIHAMVHLAGDGLEPRAAGHWRRAARPPARGDLRRQARQADRAQATMIRTLDHDQVDMLVEGVPC